MYSEGTGMGKSVEGRQYQDTVFRLYFNDAGRLRELAGALHGTTYTSVDPIEIVTLEGSFLSQVKNDVYCTQGNRKRQCNVSICPTTCIEATKAAACPKGSCSGFL